MFRLQKYDKDKLFLGYYKPEQQVERDNINKFEGPHTAVRVLWDGHIPHLLGFVPMFLTQEVQFLVAAKTLTPNPPLHLRLRINLNLRLT